MYLNKRRWSRQLHQEKMQHLQDLTPLRNFSLPKKWLPPLKNDSLFLGLKTEERLPKPNFLWWRQLQSAGNEDILGQGEKGLFLRLSLSTESLFWNLYARLTSGSIHHRLRCMLVLKSLFENRRVFNYCSTQGDNLPFSQTSSSEQSVKTVTWRMTEFQPFRMHYAFQEFSARDVSQGLPRWFWLQLPSRRFEQL